MSKSSLREGQMSDAVYVDEAAHLARNLVSRESRGPGDTENAMRRLEARYGLSYQGLWALRYRKPKALLVDVDRRLHAANEHETQRQMRRLQHELEITKLTSGTAHASVAAAQTVVDAHNKREG